jgi:hypothetical protein
LMRDGDGEESPPYLEEERRPQCQRNRMSLCRSRRSSGSIHVWHLSSGGRWYSYEQITFRALFEIVCFGYSYPPRPTPVPTHYPIIAPSASLASTLMNTATPRSTIILSPTCPFEETKPVAGWEEPSSRQPSRLRRERAQ